MISQCCNWRCQSCRSRSGRCASSWGGWYNCRWNNMSQQPFWFRRGGEDAWYVHLYGAELCRMASIMQYVKSLASLTYFFFFFLRFSIDFGCRSVGSSRSSKCFHGTRTQGDRSKRWSIWQRQTFTRAARGSVHQRHRFWSQQNLEVRQRHQNHTESWHIQLYVYEVIN